MVCLKEDADGVESNEYYVVLINSSVSPVERKTR